MKKEEITVEAVVAPPDNDMRLTAGTTAVRLRQGCEPAADAGRSTLVTS